MTPEDQLLETWRQLPQPLRQEVLDFAQFLAERQSPKPTQPHPPAQSSAVGDRLQAIRDQIVESGMPLLTREQVEQEVRDRRGGYQE